MIAVVDYGSGNIHSIGSALYMVGADVVVTKKPEDLQAASHIVLPGVGAFGVCAANLRASGVEECLAEEVLEKGKPFYGICVGMQVLAREGHEFGVHKGLGWLNGIVKRFEVDQREHKIPHVGWNEVLLEKETPLFNGIIPKDKTFYFTHSYHFVADDADLIAANCEYGETFPAALQRDNIFATQFHPEKSQENGLKVLENFLNWKP
jgi:imidazole glycerol-phosphate synthase subunit HisH